MTAKAFSQPSCWRCRLTNSVEVAGTLPRDNKADDCSDPGSDGYGFIFIWVLMHRFVGGLRGLDRLVAGTAGDFLGVFKRDGESSELVRQGFFQSYSHFLIF
jgi:hypothetical protein